MPPLGTLTRPGHHTRNHPVTTRPDLWSSPAGASPPPGGRGGRGRRASRRAPRRAPHPLLPNEPDAATVLRDGAALVTASGDKLLGGPQAGLLLGRAELIGRLRRHPSARALRVDKLTLAALEATLTGPPVPVRVALETPAAALRDRAERLAEHLHAGGIDAFALQSTRVVGRGAQPRGR